MTATATPSDHTEQALLRDVVEALAPLERRPGSPGERQAATWIAERLERAGCSARVEEAQFRDGYAPLMAGLSAAGAVAALGALAGRRARKPAALLGASVAAAIADDASNGPRLVRRATTTPRTTWNVVGQAGDPSAQRTLVG